MTFERSTDYALIREVMTHPAIWPMISDDFAPAPEDWKPTESDSVLYILARDGDDLLGFWLFVPWSPILYEVHTVLLPSCGYMRGREAARQMADWIFRNTGCLRIFTHVPVYNRAAMKFARAAGMQQFGNNVMSYMKNGKLHDQILLGMSKPTTMEAA